MPSRQAPQEKNIEVVVRCRPRNSAEKKAGSQSVIECNSKKKSVTLSNADKQSKIFCFDKVFGPEATQIELYKSVVVPIIDEVLQGYNCTVFAYGQTGTGKTYTMEGERTEGTSSWEDDPKSGVIPRTLHQLFERLEGQDCEFSVRVSFLELYNEEIFDLLTSPEDTSKLRLYEDASRKGSVIIQGLEEVPVRSREEVYTIMTKGAAKRQTAATLMNAHSSRSHSVFCVTVHIKENSCDGEELVKTGKFNLVDLAGSESIGRSGAVDKRAREAGNINQSLLTLGRVITALVDRAPHVPYRESKLTRLLQDSLGGRTKTCIIATVSPALINLEETVSTLDYAHRAKNIMNRPEVNQKLTKRALIKEYTEEIDRLKRDLAACRDKNGIFVAPENYSALNNQLVQQKDSITALEVKVTSLTTELTEISSLFTKTNDELEGCQTQLSDLKADLEGIQLRLKQTKGRLRDTKKDLLETRVEREKNKFLFEQHQSTGEQLSGEGSTLLGAVTASVADVDGLHCKLDRRLRVDQANAEEMDAFKQEFGNQVKALEASLQQGLQQQVAAHDSLSQRLLHLLQSSRQQVCTVSEHVQTLSANIQSGVEAMDNQQKTMLSATQVSLSRAEEDSKAAWNSTRDLVDNDCQLKILPTLAGIRSTLPLLSETLVELQRGVLDQLSVQEAEIRSFAAKHADQLRALALLQETYKQDQNEQLQYCTAILKERMEEMQRMQDAMVTDLCNVFDGSAEKGQDHCADAQQKLAAATSDVTAMATGMSGFSSAVTDCVKTKFSQATESVTAVQRHTEQCQNHTKALASSIGKVTSDLQQQATEMIQQHLSSVECHMTTMRSSQQQITTSIATSHSELLANVQRLMSSQEEGCSESEREVTACRSAFEHLIVGGCSTLEGMQERVEHFFSVELSRDVETGATPARRDFPHPKKLTNQPDNDELIKQFHDLFSYSQVNSDLMDDSFADLSSALSPAVSNGSRLLRTPSPANLSLSLHGLTPTEDAPAKENTFAAPAAAIRATGKSVKSARVDGPSKTGSRPLGSATNRQFMLH